MPALLSRHVYRPVLANVTKPQYCLHIIEI